MTESAVGPAYRRGLARFAGAAAPPPPDDARLVPLTAQDDGATLSCRVDPDTHRIVWMDIAGADATHKALLAAFAHVAVGHTVQDVAEHAAIRLENLLRDRAAPPPVAGIVQPENADPAFARLLRLARRILDTYVRLTGYRPQENHEDVRASEAWLAAGPAERVRRILAVVPERHLETGLRKADIQIKGIEQDTKVFLALPENVPPATRQTFLAWLESEVQSRVEPRLELYLEYARDKNAKRRHQLPPR